MTSKSSKRVTVYSGTESLVYSMTDPSRRWKLLRRRSLISKEDLGPIIVLIFSPERSLASNKLYGPSPEEVASLSPLGRLEFLAEGKFEPMNPELLRVGKFLVDDVIFW